MPAASELRWLGQILGPKGWVWLWVGEVTAWGGAEGRAEGGDECAWLVVAAEGGGGRDVVALAEGDHAVLKAELCSPMSESGSGLGCEEALEGAFVGADVVSELAKRSAVTRIGLEGFGDGADAGVVEPGEAEWGCWCGSELVDDDGFEAVEGGPGWWGVVDVIHEFAEEGADGEDGDVVGVSDAERRVEVEGGHLAMGLGDDGVGCMGRNP